MKLSSCLLGLSLAGLLLANPAKGLADDNLTNTMDDPTSSGAVGEGVANPAIDESAQPEKLSRSILSKWIFAMSGAM
jgi:hypothetical protein